MRLGWLAVPAAVLLLSACGEARPLSPHHRARPAAASSRSWRGRPGLLLRGLHQPAAYAAGGFLYVTQQVTPPGARVRSELMRVDPVRGRVYAARRLGSAFDDALLTRGGLWITSTRGQTSWLWRLDPRSLAVRSRRVLPGRGPETATLAVAGGWLWVGASDRLDRIALPRGAISGQVALPGSQGVEVAANPAGTILLLSEGQERAHLQRRNPRTGALISTSALFEGVTRPSIGGIIDGAVWISQAGGMMGFARRLSLGTLRPEASPRETMTSPLNNATNGIEARVFDRILWVTQPAGGWERNYCGDPVTGRPRVPLPPPLRGDGVLLTVSATSIYYVPDIFSRGGQQLIRAPIDPRCRGAAGDSNRRRGRRGAGSAGDLRRATPRPARRSRPRTG